jgi:hypothetical protein
LKISLVANLQTLLLQPLPNPSKGKKNPKEEDVKSAEREISLGRGGVINFIFAMSLSEDKTGRPLFCDYHSLLAIRDTFYWGIDFVIHELVQMVASSFCK